MRLEPGLRPLQGYDYRLLSQLGGGGAGVVWKAEGPGGILCAMKFIPPTDGLGMQEYRSLRQLRHLTQAHLVSLHGVWFVDDRGQVFGEATKEGDSSVPPTGGQTLVVAMSLGSGTLGQRLKQCQEKNLASPFGGIPFDELHPYMANAASGLDFLHSPIHLLAGDRPVALRHGDVKPANMLVMGNTVLLCDFGLASIVKIRDRVTSKPLYTPMYASPEVLQYKSPSTASDQYSLAVTYYELRTGRIPYPCGLDSGINAVLCDIVEHNVELDPALPKHELAALAKALKSEPSERFRTCMEFVDALRPPAAVRAVVGPVPKYADLFKVGSKTVPSHTLVRLLLQSGSVEFWEGRAKGDVPVAIKIVRDLVESADREERQAIDLVKFLGHESMLGVRISHALDEYGRDLDDATPAGGGRPKPAYLAVVSEFASQTLEHELRKYRAKQATGIPNRQLGDYMTQAAAVIDYLAGNPRGQPRGGGLSHRDVTPDTLYIDPNNRKRIRLGNFESVCEFTDRGGTVAPRSYNLSYAAPELVRNLVHVNSDQYSLALTFYKLRTGREAIDSNVPGDELLEAVVNGRLDLRGLTNELELEIVQRATSRNPENRFASCSEMVDALWKAMGLSTKDVYELDPALLKKKQEEELRRAEREREFRERELEIARLEREWEGNQRKQRERQEQLDRERRDEIELRRREDAGRRRRERQQEIKFEPAPPIVPRWLQRTLTRVVLPLLVVSAIGTVVWRRQPGEGVRLLDPPSVAAGSDREFLDRAVAEFQSVAGGDLAPVVRLRSDLAARFEEWSADGDQERRRRVLEALLDARIDGNTAGVEEQLSPGAPMIALLFDAWLKKPRSDEEVVDQLIALEGEADLKGRFERPLAEAFSRVLTRGLADGRWSDVRDWCGLRPADDLARLAIIEGSLDTDDPLFQPLRIANHLDFLGKVGTPSTYSYRAYLLGRCQEGTAPDAAADAYVSAYLADPNPILAARSRRERAARFLDASFGSLWATAAHTNFQHQLGDSVARLAIKRISTALRIAPAAVDPLNAGRLAVLLVESDAARARELTAGLSDDAFDQSKDRALILYAKARAHAASSDPADWPTAVATYAALGRWLEDRLIREKAAATAKPTASAREIVDKVLAPAIRLARKIEGLPEV